LTHRVLNTCLHGGIERPGIIQNAYAKIQIIVCVAWPPVIRVQNAEALGSLPEKM